MRMHLRPSHQLLTTVNAALHSAVPPAWSKLLPMVELAAEELLVNIFTHAHPATAAKGAGPDAQMECTLDNLHGHPCIRLTISDAGSPFNPFSDAPPPALTRDAVSRPVGGLGIHLVRSIAQQCRYRREEGRNILDLFFVPFFETPPAQCETPPAEKDRAVP